MRRRRLAALAAAVGLVACAGYGVGRQLGLVPGTGTSMTAAGVWPPVAGFDDLARASPDFAPAAARGADLVERLRPPDAISTSGQLHVGGAHPLFLSHTWESEQSARQLHDWLLRQRPGGLALARLPTPSGTPTATSAPLDTDVGWVVPADAAVAEGLLSAHIDTKGSGSMLTVDLAQEWVDTVPARFQGRPGRPRYAVTDASHCPRMPTRPWFRGLAIDEESPEGIEGAVNTGYDVTSRLLPDGEPIEALRCTYTRSAPFADVGRTAETAQRLDAAPASTLARRLRSLPTAQVHHVAHPSLELGLDSTGYVVFTYPGRGPVTLSFLGDGVTNGDLLIHSPAPGTTSPLYPHGTAAVDDLFRWR